MTARGGTILAGWLLVLLGVYHFFTGIAGFARDNFYNVGQNYPYQASNDTWGWIHVVGGVVLAVVGLALFSRNMTWARPVAIVLLLASAIANFFFLVYFPLWALLMIAIAVFCIWAIAREGSEIREQRAAFGTRAQPQAGMGTQQQAGMYGTQPREREQVGMSSGAQQTGQRWPENVGGREESAGRSWSPSDIKEGGRPSGKPQEQPQSASAARGGQSGRNAAEEAAERARQAGRDYRSGR